LLIKARLVYFKLKTNVLGLMVYRLLICCVLSVTSTFAQSLILDTAFPVGGGANGAIHAVELTPNGKVLLGGSFLTYGGVSGKGLVRTLANGNRDGSFSVGTGVDTRIQELKALPNGKVYLGGAFGSYQGVTHGNFLRIDTSGAADPSFAIGTGFNNEITGLDAYTNGNVLVGGFFNRLQGNLISQPVKLLANGQRDTTFNVGGTGTNQLIEVIRIQPDDKVLIGGTVTLYNGQTVGRLFRIHPNGQLDTTFRIGSGFGGPVLAIDLTSDGRIVVGGGFTTFNGQSINRIVRLMPDGALDSSFTPGLGVNSTLRALKVQKNGNTFIGGDFTTVNGLPSDRVAILDQFGGLLFPSASCASSNGTIHSVIELPDSSLIIGGVFSQIGGIATGRVARLTANGGALGAGQPLISGPTSTLQCPGNLVSLSLTGNLGSATSWRWYAGSCGGTSLGSGTNIFVRPNVTTTYYARAEGSCIAPGPCDSIVLVVRDTLAPVPLLANLPRVSGLCGLSLAAPVAFDNCSGTIVGQSNVPLPLNTAGTYNIIWSFTDSTGNTSTQTQEVVVDSLDLNVVQLNNQLTAQAINVNYQWLNCNTGFTVIPNANSRQFTPTTSGTYAVRLSNQNCIDTSACYNVVFTSVNQMDDLGISVFPNPGNDHFTITSSQRMHVALRDASGRQLYMGEITEGTNALTIQMLPAGLYFWEFSSENIKVHKKQLIY